MIRFAALTKAALDATRVSVDDEVVRYGDHIEGLVEAWGAATLEELTPEVYRKLAEMTEYLRAGVLQVGADFETPVQVTGLGSLFGLHFTGQELIGYRDIAAEDSAFRHQVFLGLLNEGILMAANLVGAVSTEIGEKEIDAFTAALRRVLERALTPSG